jgi:hypothetical protein
MTEPMKPPPRRRKSGRVLGATKQAQASSPPPSAELTREELKAEQAAAAAADTGERLGDTSGSGNVQQQSQSPSVESPPAGPPTHTAPAEQERSHSPAQDAPDEASAAETESPALAPASRPESTAAAQAPAQPEPSPPTEVVVRPTPFEDEVARPDAAASGTPGTQHEQTEPPHAQGQSWVQGPGRPKNIPSAAAVLNQRTIKRESLDASLAAELRLKRRLRRLALDNELDHLPLGDIVTVALDDWVTERGY